MAVSTAVPTVIKQWADSTYTVIGTLAIGASALTYSTGGIALNFAIPEIKASRVPISVSVSGIAGYNYSYVAGADATAGLLMIRGQKNAASNYDALIELSTGAIPAGVSGDTVTFIAVWKGME
jgi:hypothetical protein